jgi:hypothetical protein
MSRSARVDLPWSICAMIAKLRIWLSGVIRAEHKAATIPYQRERLNNPGHGHKSAVEIPSACAAVSKRLS